MSQGSALHTVYAVFSDVETAENIATAMVERRLAACVNILAPCQSIYSWNGNVARGTEVPALFKTASGKVEALISAIAELHPYEVPAITAWAINAAHPPYGDWVIAGTQ